jgi:hypothetical protein
MRRTEHLPALEQELGHALALQVAPLAVLVQPALLLRRRREHHALLVAERLGVAHVSPRRRHRGTFF